MRFAHFRLFSSDEIPSSIQPVCRQRTNGFRQRKAFAVGLDHRKNPHAVAFNVVGEIHTMNRLRKQMIPKMTPDTFDVGVVFHEPMSKVGTGIIFTRLIDLTKHVKRLTLVVRAITVDDDGTPPLTVEMMKQVLRLSLLSGRPTNHNRAIAAISNLVHQKSIDLVIRNQLPGLDDTKNLGILGLAKKITDFDMLSIAELLRNTLCSLRLPRSWGSKKKKCQCPKRFGTD